MLFPRKVLFSPYVGGSRSVVSSEKGVDHWVGRRRFVFLVLIYRSSALVIGRRLYTMPGCAKVLYALMPIRDAIFPLLLRTKLSVLSWR